MYILHSSFFNIVCYVFAIRSHPLLLLLHLYPVAYVHHVLAISRCAQPSILPACAWSSSKLGRVGCLLLLVLNILVSR